MNGRIQGYVSKSGLNIGDSLRSQWGFGDDVATEQLSSILGGSTVLDVGGIDGVAQTVLNEQGQRVVSLSGYREGMSAEEQLALGLVLQHEAHRDGIVGTASQQAAETLAATTAHTQMALRMLGDGKGNALQMTENMAMDITAYQISQHLGDDSIFAGYVAGSYDASADYWKRTWGGQLVNDGSGWLRDENGKYINIDGTLSDEPIPGQTLGATGIETGLLNILEGTSSQGYNTFSDEQVLAAQKLMMDAGMSPTNPNASFRDRAWGWKKGHKLDMNDFMETAGETVPDSIFDAYYNNTVDSQLAKAWNIDLGFERNHEVPEVLQDRYSNLVTRHLQETDSPAELEAKYKFSVYDKDGVATKLFKLSEDNPFLDDLLGQHDLLGLNSYIDAEGCNFMTLLSIPQLLTGTIFDINTVDSIYKDALNKGIIKEDTYVNDRTRLAGLGWSFTSFDYNIKVGAEDRKNITVGNRIYMNGVKHYALGNSQGSLIYNPGYSVGRKEYDKVVLYDYD